MGRGLILMRKRINRGLLSPSPKRGGEYPVLAVVSNCYSGHKGRLSTRYSPVRHSTGGTNPPFAFDLHVLSTLPAFNLSQNQTLQFEFFARLYYRDTKISKIFPSLRYSLVNEPRLFARPDLLYKSSLSSRQDFLKNFSFVSRRRFI